MPADRIFGAIAAVAFALDAVLLGKMVYDLGRLHWAMAVAMGAFYAGFLGVAGANVIGLTRGAPAGPPLSSGARVALALAVPVALFASVLDCMGIELEACTTSCAVLTRGVAPAVALLTAAYAATAGRGWMRAAGVGAIALAVPNCLCRNPVNRGWIALLGQSPACFAASLGVFLVASTALVSRRRVAASIALAWIFAGAMLLFWVGHHYYRVPW